MNDLISKNIIVGTAGHVDHGKTELIKALSGIDTDRLLEEKKRGITIELGFASIPNDAGLNIGVIDVPGHEKFLNNMLAGVSGIDIALLVIAADEGIMPQTREHFEILNSLGISEGIIVITKSDLVDADWLELVTGEIIDFVKGSFLENKPIIPVSSKTGYNIDKLKSQIIELSSGDRKRHLDKDLFRLPVDRVFTITGFGTVVTGTLTDGAVSLDDEIYIYPGRRPAKVRGIQVYGKDSDAAFAGQRTAINLPISKSEIKRGDVLASADSVIETKLAKVSLTMFKSAELSIKHNSRVHFFTGSTQLIARVSLLDQDKLEPGATGFATLYFEQPVPLRFGDRFILRFLSPLITVSGGVILDPMPIFNRKDKQATRQSFEILDSGNMSAILEYHFKKRPFNHLSSLSHPLGLSSADVREEIENLINDSQVIALNQELLIHRFHYDKIKEQLTLMLTNFHQKNPQKQGIQKSEFLQELREITGGTESELLELMQNLNESGLIKVQNNFVQSPDFLIQDSGDYDILIDKIKSIFKQAGIEVPDISTIYELSDADSVKRALDELLNSGALIKLDKTIFISSESWDLCISALERMNESFTLAEFRDELATSRKYASIILSGMDKLGLTYFRDDKRTKLI